MIDREQDHIGPSLVEGGIRLQRLLQKLIVGAHDAFQGKAVTCGRRNQHRGHEIERAVANQAQTKRNERSK